jgi:hypothetical protein
MDVILDSNIFRADFSLKSRDVDALLDYLQKTGSKIVLPQIVLDETRGLYSKTLSERISELNKVAKNVNITLTDAALHFKPHEINEADELEKYEGFILNRLGITSRDITPYNNSLLPEIVNRMIDRIKPSGEDGQGFRDTIIWLSIKEYTSKAPRKHVALISSNSKDFSTPDKSDLHETLAKECEETGIKVYYFKSIRDFLAEHSSKIAFVTEEWILSNLDYKEIAEAAKDLFSGYNDGHLLSRLTNKRECPVHSYVVMRAFPDENKTEGFFVYEMLDNSLHVNLTILADLEFAVKYQEEYWNGKFFDVSEFDDIVYLEEELFITIVIKDGVIIDTDVITI